MGSEAGVAAKKLLLVSGLEGCFMFKPVLMLVCMHGVDEVHEILRCMRS
jgi:hypothetical protein